MSYLTQMLGLAVQNFLSAATGVAVLIALIRGFVRKSANGIGNFWVDLTRCTLYVLLPLSLVLALALVSQGVPQNFKPYESVPLLQTTTATETVKDADGNVQKDAAGKDVTKESPVDRTEPAARPGPPRRSRSSSSVPTAAATSTSTRRTRMRTRRRWRIS